MLEQKDTIQVSATISWRDTTSLYEDLNSEIPNETPWTITADWTVRSINEYP